MEPKLTFDQNVVFYDRHRPTYGARIYQDVLAYSGFGHGKQAIEVGCGTGQATRPFLDAGGNVTAVELGENLTAFTRHKFAGYHNFEVVNADFTQFSAAQDSIDLVYSATAFHWVSHEKNNMLGHRLAHGLLKPGGALAIWWNNPRGTKDAALHNEIQACYMKYAPANAEQKQQKMENSEKWYKDRHGYEEKILTQLGFGAIESKLYQGYRTFTGEAYVELLHTYSDHMSLPDALRLPLFDAIGECVTKRGGITLQDTVDLYMARKQA